MTTQALVELLREASATCVAASVEDGISNMRREYRKELSTRLNTAASDLIESMAQRVPLTEEQIIDINAQYYNIAFRNFDSDIAIARTIEQAHGIRSEK